VNHRWPRTGSSSSHGGSWKPPVLGPAPTTSSPQKVHRGQSRSRVPFDLTAKPPRQSKEGLNSGKVALVYPSCSCISALANVKQTMDGISPTRPSLRCSGSIALARSLSHTCGEYGRWRVGHGSGGVLSRGVLGVFAGLLNDGDDRNVLCLHHEIHIGNLSPVPGWAHRERVRASTARRWETQRGTDDKAT
jgi:hypothetical protein